MTNNVENLLRTTESYYFHNCCPRSLKFEIFSLYHSAIEDEEFEQEKYFKFIKHEIDAYRQSIELEELPNRDLPF
jgi:hypothetical protein